MKVTINELAKMCANARMSQEDKFTYKGREVVLAYGFSACPEQTFAKFGVGPGEHNNGAYGAMFGIFEDNRLSTGGCPIWDAFADTHLPVEERKRQRLALARSEAKRIIDGMQQERTEGLQ